MKGLALREVAIDRAEEKSCGLSSGKVVSPPGCRGGAGNVLANEQGENMVKYCQQR